MKNIFYLMVVPMLWLGACNQNIELTSGLEDFNVRLGAETYRAGEEVEFLLEGNPDLITFYSGELYHQYGHRHGRILEMSGALLSFASARTSGAGRQPDQLRVLVSTDFNGDYSSFDHLKLDEWVDITDEFDLGVSSAFVPSGFIDLSEYIVEGKSLYVAFRYVARPQSIHGHLSSWMIQSFSLFGNTVAGPFVVGDMGNAGFVFVEEKPEIVPSASTQTATRVTLSVPLTVDDELLPGEIWAVSRGFDLEGVDLGSDLPDPIKGNIDPHKTTHRHRYLAPGTYKAHFIATNANVDGRQQVLRELEVTIVE